MFLNPAASNLRQELCCCAVRGRSFIFEAATPILALIGIRQVEVARRTAPACTISAADRRRAGAHAPRASRIRTVEKLMVGLGRSHIKQIAHKENWQNLRWVDADEVWPRINTKRHECLVALFVLLREIRSKLFFDPRSTAKSVAGNWRCIYSCECFVA